MAFLKYKGEDGNFVAINYYKVNNVIVSQTKGQSTADVYTKSHVDTVLNTKANTTDIPTKVSQLTNDSRYLTTH